MQPVKLTIRTAEVLPHVVAVVVKAGKHPCGYLLLSHDQYVGLVAALEVGASQSEGLLTIRQDNAKWRKWHRRHAGGYPETSRPLKTPPRAISGSRRPIPVKTQTHKGQP